jgi:hypothetical protein
MKANTMTIDRIEGPSSAERNNYPKVFTLKIDAQMDHTLNTLQKHFQRQNRSDVFRMAVSLLDLVREAEEKKHKVMIGDGETGVVFERLTFLR